MHLCKRNIKGVISTVYICTRHNLPQNSTNISIHIFTIITRTRRLLLFTCAVYRSCAAPPFSIYVYAAVRKQLSDSHVYAICGEPIAAGKLYLSRIVAARLHLFSNRLLWLETNICFLLFFIILTISRDASPLILLTLILTFQKNKECIINIHCLSRCLKYLNFSNIIMMLEM